MIKSHSHGRLGLLLFALAVFLTGCSHVSVQNLDVDRLYVQATSPDSSSRQQLTDAVDPALADDDLDFLDEDEQEPISGAARDSDPLEGYNRAIFKLNDTLYRHALRPAARAYNKVLAQSVRQGVQNFFTNLAFPVRFVSCLFQGKFEGAQAQFSRFFYNSTVGLLGLRDIALKYPRFLKGDEDMGQALAAWGVGEGAFIMWPVLGPFTLRSSLGYIEDRLLNPTSFIGPIHMSLAVSSYDYFNYASLHLDAYEALEQMALDPYEAMRNAYLQMRRNKIKQ